MACASTPLFTEALRHCYEQAIFVLMRMATEETAEEEYELGRQYTMQLDRFLYRDQPAWFNNRNQYVDNVIQDLMVEFPGIEWTDDKVREEEIKARTAYAENMPRPARPVRVFKVLEEVKLRDPTEEEEGQFDQKIRDGQDVQLVGAKWVAYPHLMDTVRYIVGIEAVFQDAQEDFEQEEEQQ